MDSLMVLGVGLLALAALGIASYFILRRLFDRVADRVADRIGSVFAELVGRASTTRTGQRTASHATRLRMYAQAAGMSEDAARREFAQSIERIARIMDSAVRLPIIGPVGLDAALGLFPVAGDAVSAAIAVLLIARSLKYGVPHDIIARMLANVLFDMLIGAVPVAGDVADLWFRANVRNVELLRRYLEEDARNVIDVSPIRD